MERALRATRRAIGLSLVAMVGARMMASCQKGDAVSDVTAGPSLGGSGIPFGSNVAKMPGYTETEFILSGKANVWGPDGTWTKDGRWAKKVLDPQLSYTTRILVDRPTDATKFNGTVWVEWLNVSAGSDASPGLGQAREEVVRSGAAWVGVSAQSVGVNALKSSDAQRYGKLGIPNDGVSYDVFSQAAKAVRKNPQILGGLPVARVIGTGESQSAMRLHTYANAWQNSDQVFDGLLIHSRFESAAPAGAGFGGGVAADVRDDVNVPVFQIQTETDLPGWLNVRQPDSATLRTWEVAGSAHFDAHGLAQMGLTDTSTLCSKPVNDFPFHYAAKAAYRAMDGWVRDNTAPLSAPPIEIVGDVIQRDADGNAKGGLRLPEIDAPRATHSGVGNSGGAGVGAFCGIFGMTTPFSPARLAELYPTHNDYIFAYTEAALEAFDHGYLTPEDLESVLDEVLPPV